MKKIVGGFGFDSNCYIISRFDECVIIDPSSEVSQIKEAIKDMTLTAILLTHGHLDHVDAIGAFDVPVYIHEKELPLLKDNQLNGYNSFKMKPSFELNKIEFRLVKDHDKIPLADEAIEVIHTPGHTIGSVTYYYKDKLYTGDTLFMGSIGNYTFPTGNLNDIKRSILHLMQTYPANTKIYPGHGESTTIRQEAKSNPYYLKWKK